MLSCCKAANFAHVRGNDSIQATLRIRKLLLACKHEVSAFLFEGVLNSYNQLMNPNSGLESFETRFSEIINHEWSGRENKKFNRLLKQATLKYPAADLDSSLYDPERQLNTHVIELLAKGDWIDEPNNLLITGGAGAGKTHVACALCVTALHQMRTVKYIRANYLLQESAHAHSEDNYYEYSNKMAGYDLLVIDDFG